MASLYPKNFNSGLIVNAQGIQLSDSLPLKPHQDGTIKNTNTSFNAKLVLSKTKKESFLSKNHIEIELSEDNLKHVSRIFDIDETVNEPSINDVFLTIKCLKTELIIEKQIIKPSDELIDKVKEALEHYDPYHKLMDVFNRFGYFLPTKLVLGHKIYRIAHLIANESLSEPKNIDDVKWTTLEDFSEFEIGQLLSQWEKCVSSHNVDVSYFASINGELIMKDEFKEWIKDCLESDLNSLSVISCEGLYPLYEIFEVTLRQEVESALGINNQKMVLMAGSVPIEGPPYSYFIKFPVCFKSNDYQVFGKYISRDGKPIDKVTIKFDSMDTNGFLIFIECQKGIEKDSQIAWIIIGIPAKVGYFSTDTRKIKILSSGDVSFAEFENFEVPKNLPLDTVLVTTFKYPLSNYEPNFGSPKVTQFTVNENTKKFDEDNEKRKKDDNNYKPHLNDEYEIGFDSIIDAVQPFLPLFQSVQTIVDSVIMNDVNDNISEQKKELAQLSEKFEQFMKQTSSIDPTLLEAYREPDINARELILDHSEDDFGKTVLKRTYRGLTVACKKMLVEKNDVKPHVEFAILRRLGTSPEKISHAQYDSSVKYNHQCEMYSFGILLWELCHQRIPYENINSILEIEQLVRDKKREKITLDPSPIAQELFKIIKQAWNHNPSERPQFMNVLSTLKEVYEKFENNPKDYSEIIKYIKMSADNGNEIAYYNLAIIYMEGLYTEQINKEKAKHYARLAASKGHSNAIELLKKLNVGNTDA
ncbi:21072_t:CDS:2 [Dentiscutata erythropus]|uniref:21072_t:CDS:1 n=1 Tax=Dentiscutata erythropus TaxID=1348616 RepID=A0A9N9HF35_9GLOM|nr:21072_t:CDS:2 [Dentiscutata erythropus]